MRTMRTRNKLRGILVFLSLIVLFLLSPLLVSGIGVSPGKKTLDFQPNKTVEFSIALVNTEQNTYDAGLSVSGELADIIFFEKDTFSVTSDMYRIPFKVIIKFPSELEPGIRKGIVKITPRIQGPGNNVFAAYVSPQALIHVRVPFPAKYAVVNLVVLEVDEGTPVPIYLEFDNLGSEDISRAGGSIEISDPDNKPIGTVDVPEIQVRKNVLGKTQAKPSPVLRRGLYHTVVNAYYDEVKEEIRTNFTLGEPVLRIREVKTKELALNEINKVVFRAYNDWNTKLAAKGFIKIKDRQDEMPDFELGADEEKEITGFFDTTGFASGEYNMSLTLTYANQLRTEVFWITLSEEARIEEEKPTRSPLILALIIVVILIILFLVVSEIKKRKSLRERKL